MRALQKRLEATDLLENKFYILIISQIMRALQKRLEATDLLENKFYILIISQIMRALQKRLEATDLLENKFCKALKLRVQNSRKLLNNRRYHEVSWGNNPAVEGK